MFGISLSQLGIILLIVVLIFGTRKLRSLGKDVGSAVHDFRAALQDEGKEGQEGKPAGESAPEQPPQDRSD